MPPRTDPAPIEISPARFREIGHRVVDDIAGFLASLPGRPVNPAETPSAVRELLPASMPSDGEEPQRLLEEAAALLFEHSLFNGHPRFWAYISSSAAPIGALADLLASTVNANVGGWAPAPVATEIEAQTVRWIAQLVGFPSDCGGILVSGGNAANFVGVLAARKATAGWDIRRQGLAAGAPLALYASTETHTWVQKAADLYGFGLDAIRFIDTDERQRMRIDALRERIAADVAAGVRPLVVVGTAGTVSTGAVDPLPEIASVCREHGAWFHVDGAYGAFAAGVPGAPDDLRGIAEADSVALDPHKWLYAPLEAGCALIRDAEALRSAFSFSPPYYALDQAEPAINYHEYGPQNSRGFRALKVWLGLRQVGREGATRMIAEDIALARALAGQVDAHPQLELGPQSLSITTFRYVPPGVGGGEPARAYLNDLNTALLKQIQDDGRAYVSNAVIGGNYFLRACVVNFRTTLADIETLPSLVAELGAPLDKSMRPAHLPLSRA
jgi:glutamate/tyrosine decarboxylase-like PLP-dependent enzyme